MLSCRSPQAPSLLPTIRAFLHLPILVASGQMPIHLWPQMKPDEALLHCQLRALSHCLWPAVLSTQFPQGLASFCPTCPPHPCLPPELACCCWNLLEPGTETLTQINFSSDPESKMLLRKILGFNFLGVYPILSLNCSFSSKCHKVINAAFLVLTRVLVNTGCETIH